MDGKRTKQHRIQSNKKSNKYIYVHIVKAQQPTAILIHDFIVISRIVYSVL